MMEMYVLGHQVGFMCGLSGFLVNNPARCLELAHSLGRVYMTPRHAVAGFGDGMRALKMGASRS